MENIFTMIIILLNVFAVTMVYKMLAGNEISYRIKLTIILLVVTFVLSYIMYEMTSVGISGELRALSKPFIVFTIFPINTMVMATPIAIQFNKAKSEEIDQDTFSKKVVRLLIIDLVFIIVACIYLKNIQTGMVAKLN